jgi:hypothetical protein
MMAYVEYAYLDHSSGSGGDGDGFHLTGFFSDSGATYGVGGGYGLGDYKGYGWSRDWALGIFGDGTIDRGM